MAKKIIRLTENDLHKLIKESVKKVIKEWVPDPSDYLQYEPGNQEEEEYVDPLDDYNEWRLDNPELEGGEI